MDCVNRKGLDFSKVVLWESVGQRVAEISAIKVGGLKKDFAHWPSAGEAGSQQNFFLSFNFDGW